MLWTETDAVALAKTMYRESNGSPTMESAAVAWCVLNRVDNWGGTIIGVLSAPNQFAYSSSAPVTDYFYNLAVDVLTRWSYEHNGQADVSRVLPSTYMWFSGDGSHNHFRNAYAGGSYWDWSLPNPYN